MLTTVGVAIWPTRSLTGVLSRARDSIYAAADDDRARGRVWHCTGANTTTEVRRAVAFGWYTRPIYRTQENWFLSLDPSVRQFASDDLLVLLGYRTAGLGLVNGISPA